MKHWNVRSFLAGGLVTALILSLAIPALAATIKTAELHYDDIKIMLNGEAVKPTDASGQVVEPFSIDGTTYLPVRAIGEALGLNVNWDGATKTITLDRISNSFSLLDVKCVSGSYSSNSKDDKGPFYANDGSSYKNYLSPQRSMEYDFTVTPYTRFTGVWYLPQLNKNMSNQNRFLVYLDDKVIFTSETLTAGAKPQPFDISITGGTRFMIEVQVRDNDTAEWHTPTNRDFYGAFGNALFWD